MHLERLHRLREELDDVLERLHHLRGLAARDALLVHGVRRAEDAGVSFPSTAAARTFFWTSSQSPPLTSALNVAKSSAVGSSVSVPVACFARRTTETPRRVFEPVAPRAGRARAAEEAAAASACIGGGARSGSARVPRWRKLAFQSAESRETLMTHVDGTRTRIVASE